MKISARVLLPAVACILSLSALFLFRTVPQSRLWKGWTLLYVRSSTLDEEAVAAVLAEHGCTGVVRKGTQRAPVVSPFSPLQPQPEDSYLQRRNAFFSDESRQAMVFYVPDGRQTALSRTIDALSEMPDTDCGTDSAAAFPYLAPLVCLVFALAAVALSERRLHLASAALFIVCMAFSRPLFTVAVSGCLALTGIFLLLKLLGRTGSARRASRSPLAVLLLVSPLFVLCASSPVNVIFYILTLAAACCAMFLVEEAREARYKGVFRPVYIRSAYAVPLIAASDVRTFVSLSVCCVLLLFASLWGRATRLETGTRSGSPALPAPVPRGGSAELPCLDDFFAWSWRTAAFPYRRLTTGALPLEAECPVEGARITMPMYADAGGRIGMREETVLVFDARFRDDVLGALSSLGYPPLETMLARQGRQVRYAYVRGGGMAAERLGTVLLCSCTALSLSLTAYLMLRKRKYGFGS